MTSTEGSRHLDRRTAEHLLQRDRAMPHAGHHPRLAALLAAASSAAHPDELAGESAAMAAFTAAQHAPVRPARNPSGVGFTLTKLLTIKAAVITSLVVAGVGGVTFAASTGALPAPISSRLPGTHTSRPAHPGPAPSGTVLPRPSRPASPAVLAALCRDLNNRGDEEQRGKALDEQRFAELVRQAGKKDPDQVDKFCGRLGPAKAPSSSPSSRSNGSTHPGNTPSTRPGERPGYPSGKPSTPPTTRPTPAPDR